MNDEDQRKLYVNRKYKDPEELEIITLDDVIFMKMKNDLSFMIANSMNLYEHQSTYNPNMPLRGLLYFARQYEGLAERTRRNSICRMPMNQAEDPAA